MATKLFPYTRRALTSIGQTWMTFLDVLGQATLHGGAIIRFILAGRLEFRHLLQQIAFVGVDTLGIALMMTIFSGMVIALQIAREMVRQGGGDYVGALVSLTVVRELAPIMTAFSVIAMAGSAYAAELSTMRITSQVDALEVLHVNPVRYLLMPRVLATTAALPLMTVITSVAGILGGLLVSVLFADLEPSRYLDSVWNQTAMKDVAAMLSKAAVFGFVVSLVAATIGLKAKGGSREVGIATTRAVVFSFVLMAILDYVMTYLIYGTRD
jgi:phospholipid/cholesterol/gamma-HCH transport system permease protein